MLRVSKSAIKERLPSTGSFNASSQLSVGASSPSSLSPKNKLAKALKKPNSNEEYHDEEDDAKHKQSQLSKLRKQVMPICRFYLRKLENLYHYMAKDFKNEHN